MNQKEFDQSLARDLKRRLREDPRLDVKSYKRGRYMVRRRELEKKQ